ncbi:trimethylamine methyltransferase family protein, partial [Chloroflexota bacterium]
IADMARLIDALPNVEWCRTSTGHTPLPGAISDKVALLQSILNCSKPIVSVSNNVSSLKEQIDLCSIVAGGEAQLRRKPFFVASNEPVSPLIQGKDATEKSLLCAEKGIPNVFYGMPMAGATAPATFAGCLAVANAEILSQLVVLQLKYPGAPVIYGSMPNIMDMKTTIYPYGAPELQLMVGSLTELCHHYGLPMFGTGGSTDAEVVDAQAAAEVTYSVLISTLTGADLVHDVGLMYHGTILSPELTVLVSEIVDMVNVLMNGIEINDETLSLDLIEQLGPGANYLSENHTLKHFRKFWMPSVFDRSMAKKEGTKNCEELLNERTLEILRTHQPKTLPDALVRELKRVEKTWFDRMGLEHKYPQRE